VSFFICWSPFHAQRILASNIRDPNGPIMTVYQILTYISGVTYYLTATINPILYQLLSLKFRLAFKDTFGFWCPCLKAPEKSSDFNYSTVVVNGNNGLLTTCNVHDSMKLNGSFRGSISAHQLNLLNTRNNSNVGLVSAVIKCDDNGNGTNNSLLKVGTPPTIRSSSCSDMFGPNTNTTSPATNARRCLLQTTPSVITLEAKS